MKPVNIFLAATLATTAALLTQLPSTAQDKTKVTLNAFKSASLWPIWSAQKIGAFDKEGLAIDLSYTHGSKSQMTGAIEGKYDMINTALDNVIAYSEGEGAPGTPKNGDLVAFTGGNNGSLTLIAQPDIKSIKDLKGKDLAVDAISTGFSFVLREMLARNGLKPDDYAFKAFGNTGARLKALQEKKAAAGLLTPPLSLIATTRGYSNLGAAADVLGGYQATVTASTRAWAKQHSDIVVRYIRAYRAGQDWMMDPANKQAVIGVLTAEFPQMSQKIAQTLYTNLIVAKNGFDPGAKIDMAGAKTVFDLRRKYGPKGKTITDVGHFIDESYFDQAVKH